MMLIPYAVNESQFDVFIVLEPDNVDRIVNQDPGELDLRKLGTNWAGITLRKIFIGYADAATRSQIERRFQEGDLQGALAWLSRGWQFRPEAGDNDLEYGSILKVN